MTSSADNPMQIVQKQHNTRYRCIRKREHTKAVMDNELSTDTFMPGRMAELATVRNLDDALHRYNLDRNDRIGRREQVQIYREIEDNIYSELQSLSSTRRYDEANDLADRLVQLRQEFDQLQVAAEARLRKEQVDIFDEASSRLLSEARVESSRQAKAVDRLCRELSESTHRLHEIQRENLDLEIRSMSVPQTKYSKRYLELQRSEQRYDFRWQCCPVCTAAWYDCIQICVLQSYCLARV